MKIDSTKIGWKRNEKTIQYNFHKWGWWCWTEHFNPWTTSPTQNGAFKPWMEHHQPPDGAFKPWTEHHQPPDGAFKSLDGASLTPDEAFQPWTEHHQPLNGAFQSWTEHHQPPDGALKTLFGASPTPEQSISSLDGAFKPRTEHHKPSNRAFQPLDWVWRRSSFENIWRIPIFVYGASLMPWVCFIKLVRFFFFLIQLNSTNVGTCTRRDGVFCFVFTPVFPAPSIWGDMTTQSGREADVGRSSPVRQIWCQTKWLQTMDKLWCLTKSQSVCRQLTNYDVRQSHKVTADNGQTLGGNITLHEFKKLFKKIMKVIAIYFLLSKLLILSCFSCNLVSSLKKMIYLDRKAIT